MNTVLIERESAIENAMIALVTREHYLQLGAPGIGKSMLVDQLCDRIEGVSKFKLLLHQSTTPDELFGPVDLIEVADHGRWTRRRSGSITEAHIAFLDEIGRGNSVVRNALLKIILERTFDAIGMDSTKVPLVSLFAASNSSMTDDDDLDAFDDRFVIRELIQEIVDDEAFTRMITAREQAPLACIALSQIEAAQKEVCGIKDTKQVLEKIIELRHTCSAEGVRVSPRRWKKTLMITKARAQLEGDDEVTPEHLTCLTSVLWRDPEERKAVERLVSQAACPIYLVALEAEDPMADIVNSLPEPVALNYDDAVENAMVQISDLQRTSRALEAPEREGRRYVAWPM